MRRTLARSGVALKLRRLRSRFGITAPRVAVRTHVPWYWRAGASVVVLAIALALAGWIYDAGRRIAGFERSQSDSEINMLRDKTDRLQEEVSRLRGVANTSESHLQIDRATVQLLTSQVKELEEENTRLKENLAVFENLAAGGGKTAGISLGRLRIEPDATPGRYRYRILASQHGEEAKQDFKGTLQFHVTAMLENGRSTIIVLPRPDAPDAASFSVSFRAFRSLEGTFKIPPDAVIKRVEVRLMRSGAVLASDSVSL